MKKIMLCLSVGILAILLVSCKSEADYKFLNDTTEIVAIEIVQVGEDDSQGEVEQITVCVIDDIASFMDDFLQLDCYYLYTDPAGIEDNTKVIKIIYGNGEYELIDVGGQAQYTNEQQYDNYVGYRYFNRKQFEDLISKYTRT